jgi:F0F1-type ATP synthase delta subunit
VEKHFLKFFSINGVTKGLFHLLFENKRFEILDAIATEYVKLFDESNGIEVAKVTTAFPGCHLKRKFYDCKIIR